jgi:hypothetical protein
MKARIREIEEVQVVPMAAENGRRVAHLLLAERT